MFEKEAKKYSKERAKKLGINELNLVYHAMLIAYQKGAEFGYNKANEWHDLRKDSTDLPDNTCYVWTNVGSGFYDDDGWWDSFGRLNDVIAWCEPKFEEN